MCRHGDTANRPARHAPWFPDWAVPGLDALAGRPPALVAAVVLLAAVAATVGGYLGRRRATARVEAVSLSESERELIDAIVFEDLSEAEREVVRTALEEGEYTSE